VRRISSYELGSYVLEVAGVVMGVAVFIVGASDVTRIFQARSAVRHAVNEGTRCLYPTDADCIASVPGSLSAPARSYDVWVWGSGYEVPQESYVASAQWWQEPIYEAPVLTDEIVDVTVEQSAYQYRPYTVLFPTRAHVPYLVQTRNLPKVVGGEPLAPEFADPSTLAKLAPSAVHSVGHIEAQTSRVVGGSIRSSTDEKLKIGSVSFSVRNAWPTMTQDLSAIAKIPSPMQGDLPCYAGTLRSGGAAHTIDWIAQTPHLCRYRETSAGAPAVMQQRSIGVPLMLRITGTSNGTTVGGEGKVVIRMSWSSSTSGSGTHDLGGRALRYGGSGSFVPRGLDWVDIDRTQRDEYQRYDEIDLYGTLPLIPIDATVTIEFFLMSFNNRRVGWTGGAVQVWYPQYRFVEEQYECGYSPDPRACASPPPIPAPRYVTLQRESRLMAAPNDPDTCVFQPLSGAESDAQAVLDRLQARIAQGHELSPASFNLAVPTDKEVCPSKERTQSCGHQGAEYLQGCQSPPSPQEVATWCGVDVRQDGFTSITHHTTKTTTVGARRLRACSDAPLPQCARPSVRHVETVRYGGTEQCASAAAVSVPPLVVGPVYRNECVSREGEVQRMYRHTHKIPSDVSVSVTRLPSPPTFSATRPVGSCTPYHSAQGSARELLCGRGLTVAAAERCCAASEGRCRKQAVVAQGGPSGDTALDTILTAARQRVVEAVQVGYPPARYQSICSAGEADCLEVAASLDGGDSVATVAAKVSVPLRLLHLVDGRNAVVEHSSTRVLERSALR
jgi:hypothetical protein